jgi:DNA end-binding protein Ku
MSTSANHRPPAPAAGNAPAAPRPALAPRGWPSWSGLLRISLVAVPVKAYPAVTSTPATPFHLLHAGCGQRIQYHKRCPTHGSVEADAIVRGYEYAPEHWVVIEPEELDQLRPARDKALLLEHCVPVRDVDPSYYAGRSLYLVPDGAAAQHPYGVFVEALQRAGQGALGRVVLSNRRQLVLLRPCGRLLVLEVLHYPAQVRSAAAWEAELPASAATAAERELAAQLIALASAPLDWSRYGDTSTEELRALIETKVAQQPLRAPADEPVAVLSLLEALKQSVAEARQTSAASAAKSRKPRRVTG